MKENDVSQEYNIYYKKASQHGEYSYFGYDARISVLILK